MPVTIKGGGGAGFPQGWKENFKGVVHESPISKGDPVLTGIYSDIEGGLDVRPAVTTQLTKNYDGLTVSDDGKMVMRLTSWTGDVSDKFWVYNDSLLAYEEHSLTSYVGVYRKVIAAKFTPNNEYLVITAINPSSDSGPAYLFLFKLDVVDDVLTITTKINAQYLGVNMGQYVNRGGIELSDYWNTGDKFLMAITGNVSTTMIIVLGVLDLPNETVTMHYNTTASHGGDNARYTQFFLPNKVVIGYYDGNLVYEFDGVDTWSRRDDLDPLYIARGALDISDDKQFMIIDVLSSIPPFSIVKALSENNEWSVLPNPDVYPASSGIRCASFSPGATFLAVGVTESPYLYIYKRVGDVLTKVANPTVLPTSVPWALGFSADGKFLFVHYGAYNETTDILCYGLETGNMVSKVTSFSANPLSWFPSPRKNFGVALDSGNIGDEIRVNLFPTLNTMS